MEKIGMITGCVTVFLHENAILTNIVMLQSRLKKLARVTQARVLLVTFQLSFFVAIPRATTEMAKHATTAR
jgi:hypothetical protein